VYVGDVVQATLRAASCARERDSDQWRDVPVWNVGTGSETSVLELWTAVQRVEGVDLGAEFQPARVGELDRSALDASRARAELGVAIDTPLDAGLARTLEWMRERAGVDS
jgi:UDP-glucose 4-epimerase